MGSTMFSWPPLLKISGSATGHDVMMKAVIVKYTNKLKVTFVMYTISIMHKVAAFIIFLF